MQCLRCLRKLCDTFAILPSSFILGLTFCGRGTEPFATGGFSDVYEATFNGSLVAIKTLRTTTTLAPEKVYRVSCLVPKILEGLFMPDPKLLIKEVVGWKWLQHENILPFVGVTMIPPLFSIVSERMENGDISNFVKTHRDHNRLRLVSSGVRLSSYRTNLWGQLIDVVTGLEYLHKHDIIHGDLKGVSRLYARCGRLTLSINRPMFS